MTEVRAIQNAALDLKIITSERRGKFILYRELSADDASKDWLIEGLLGHAEFSVIYGHPGSGKSAFAEDAALRIAAGAPVQNRPVRRGAVLYVALERRKLVERRAIAFRIKHGPTELPFAIMGGVVDLRLDEHAKQIVAAARDVEAATGEATVLVVVDTLSRALAGGDENSPKDMGALVRSGEIIRQGTDAHVCFIHHMPKDSENLRGHGALLGAADTTILVSKGAGQRTATVIKANDSEEGAQLAFTLESVTIHGDTTAPVVVPAETSMAEQSDNKLSRNLQTMFSLLHEAGQSGLTVDQWNEKARAEGLGVKRKADLYDMRKTLRSKGLVSCYGDRWVVRQ